MKLPTARVVKKTPSTDRLENLTATLRELEQTYSRPDHPGITHVRWLIAKYLDSIDAANTKP